MRGSTILCCSTHRIIYHCQRATRARAYPTKVLGVRRYYYSSKQVTMKLRQQRPLSSSSPRERQVRDKSLPESVTVQGVTSLYRLKCEGYDPAPQGLPYVSRTIRISSFLVEPDLTRKQKEFSGLTNPSPVKKKIAVIPWPHKILDRKCHLQEIPIF